MVSRAKPKSRERVRALEDISPSACSVENFFQT